VSLIPSEVIPDGITPEQGWRAWRVEHGLLVSINQYTGWPPRQALEAECSKPPRMQWVARRYGRLVPTGRVFQEVDQGPKVFAGYVYGYETGDLDLLTDRMPTVQLPAGWGYEMEQMENEVPDEACSCGIYALRSKANFLTSSYSDRAGDAFGIVSLWGKIVPAENGFRAQYAYPFEIYTDDELLDYGVPVLPRGEFDRSVVGRKLGRR